MTQIEISTPDAAPRPVYNKSRAERLLDADQALVMDPDFGVSAMIAERALERYRFGLELMSEAVPSLRAHVTALGDDVLAKRVFTDPLVRILMEDSFERLFQRRLAASDASSDELAAVLHDAIACGEKGLGCLEARLSPRFTVGGPSNAWLWSFAGQDHPTVRTISERLRDAFAVEDGVAAVQPADERMAQSFSRASDLLVALLPATGRSALSHFSAIGVVEASTKWGRMASGSFGDLVPSTVFVRGDHVDNPWDTSNHLYHEGLHLKLFDVVRKSSLVYEAPLLHIPWREEKWSIIRAVFSFHVYAHMFLYKAAIEEFGPSLHDRFGDPKSYALATHPLSPTTKLTSEYATVEGRSRYIGNRLLGEWSQYLTADGRRLVAWLCELAGPFGLTEGMNG